MITLNGGNFGGVQYSKKDFKDGKLTIKDDNGVLWNYDLNLNSTTNTAEFIGCN